MPTKIVFLLLTQLCLASIVFAELHTRKPLDPLLQKPRTTAKPADLTPPPNPAKENKTLAAEVDSLRRTIDKYWSSKDDDSIRIEVVHETLTKKRESLISLLPEAKGKADFIEAQKLASIEMEALLNKKKPFRKEDLKTLSDAQKARSEAKKIYIAEVVSADEKKNPEKTKTYKDLLKHFVKSEQDSKDLRKQYSDLEERKRLEIDRTNDPNVHEALDSQFRPLLQKLKGQIVEAENDLEQRQRSYLAGKNTYESDFHTSDTMQKATSILDAIDIELIRSSPFHTKAKDSYLPSISIGTP